jgi:N-acetylglucosamine-6-phosphate deacetylase
MKCIGIDPSQNAHLEISFDSVITGVEPLLTPPPPALNYLSPGWIDIQVNGFAAVDYNNPGTSHADIARSIEVLYSTGVTRFFPTVITGSPEDMAGSLRNLAQAKETLAQGKAMEAFHVEGPHISPDDGPRGAHPQRWVRPPDLEEFHRWQDAARGNLRMVTVSPEWPAAPQYIEALVREGIVASIGHTKATAEQISAAVSAGATLSTHLGNGAHQVLQRHPNYIWEQMAEDRLAAGFIADGIHLPACFLKVALRAKGIERSILVTDASSPAGATPGRYRLGEQEVDLTEDNRVVLAGQTRLAGSALSMDRGIENMMRLGEVSLREAIATATRNPARVARIANRQRGLSTGERADLVEFRFDRQSKSIEVLKTWVSGELVYSKN